MKKMKQLTMGGHGLKMRKHTKTYTIKTKGGGMLPRDGYHHGRPHMGTTSRAPKVPKGASM